MKKWLLWLVMAILTVGFGSVDVGAQKFDLKMMTGPMGGSWYPLGGAIADLMQKEIPGVTVAVSPGGGVGNVEAIEFGKCDIGFSNSSSGVDGFHGRPPFKQKMTQMRQLANLYPQYFQMVVLEDSGIKSVEDLKGKRISPGPKGHTGEFAAQQVLQVHGLSYKDMAKVHHVSYTDTVALMKDGHCDAWLLTTTIPGASIMDLASARKIRLLPLREDKIKAMQQLNAGYIPRTVPKGTYQGVDYDDPPHRKCQAARRSGVPNYQTAGRPCGPVRPNRSGHERGDGQRFGHGHRNSLPSRCAEILQRDQSDSLAFPEFIMNPGTAEILSCPRSINADWMGHPQPRSFS